MRKGSKATKKYEVRPTKKQQRVAQIMLENPSITKQEALLQAGYSKNLAKTPSKVLDTVGIHTIERTLGRKLDENGLTDDFLFSALKDDIELKPQRRVKELELAMKVKGYTREKTEQTMNVLVLPDTLIKKNGIDVPLDENNQI